MDAHERPARVADPNIDRKLENKKGNRDTSPIVFHQPPDTKEKQYAEQGLVAMQNGQRWATKDKKNRAGGTK